MTIWHSLGSRVTSQQQRGRAHTHWAHSSVLWSPSCRNTVRWCGHSPPRSDSDTLQRTESRRNPSNSLKRNTKQLCVLTSATFQLFQLFRLSAWEMIHKSADVSGSSSSGIGLSVLSQWNQHGSSLQIEPNPVCISGRFKQLLRVPENTLEWWFVFPLSLFLVTQQHDVHTGYKQIHPVYSSWFGL